MELLQGVQYFYTNNGQQVGPVDGTQLIALAQGGQVTATDHIWAEGFTDWVPVTTVDQLAPLYQTQAPAQIPAPIPTAAASAPAPPTGYRPKLKPAAAAAAAAPPTTAGGQRIVKRKIDIKAKHRFRNGASFGLLMLLLIPAILLINVPSALNVFIIKVPPGEVDPVPFVSGKVLVFCGGVGAVLALTYAILSLIYLGRAWSYIQELPVARTTPGKAVGFLFLPFFNVYWLFVTFVGWTKDYNDYLDMAEADEAPRGNSGLAMTYCILAVLQAPLLHPFVMYNMCKGINYLATAPKPEAAE